MNDDEPVGYTCPEVPSEDRLHGYKAEDFKKLWSVYNAVQKGDIPPPNQLEMLQALGRCRNAGLDKPISASGKPAFHFIKNKHGVVQWMLGLDSMLPAAEKRGLVGIKYRNSPDDVSFPFNHRKWDYGARKMMPCTTKITGMRTSQVILTVKDQNGVREYEGPEVRLIEKMRQSTFWLESPSDALQNAALRRAIATTILNNAEVMFESEKMEDAQDSNFRPQDVMKEVIGDTEGVVPPAQLVALPAPPRLPGTAPTPPPAPVAAPEPSPVPTGAPSAPPPPPAAVVAPPPAPAAPVAVPVPTGAPSIPPPPPLPGTSGTPKQSGLDGFGTNNA